MEWFGNKHINDRSNDILKKMPDKASKECKFLRMRSLGHVTRTSRIKILRVARFNSPRVYGRSDLGLFCHHAAIVLICHPFGKT